MWDALAFFEWNFRGRYLNLFVDLDRITVDYLAVNLQRDIDYQRAFAGGCWADDGKHADEYNEPEE
jgi:hypothetical protein